jgi:predicted O-methyltransferase YrrM
MDWTAGYASDVEYTAGFYPEQSPVFLNFACVLNGVEPVDLSRSFTYFELGFGRGVTANLLAAANPQGRFYAADFNPGHVAGARRMAATAGLDNLTLLENSFEQLAAGAVPDLPQFDFITLHGIYTWVTAENRAHIVRFLDRYLKPGGVVYLSYNAMPGWSGSLPLQRLIIEHAQLHPGRSDAQIKGAREFIAKMKEHNSGYLTSPLIAGRLDMLQKMPPNYLVHEYMHKHWQPMYFADVARDLAEAKLDFVGSADLSANYPLVFMSAEKVAMINESGDPLFKQTVQDYFFNTSFRKDVFVRGARQMGPIRRSEVLAQFGLVLTVPRAKASQVFKLPNGETQGKAELYEPIFDALADGPRTLADMGKLPALGHNSLATWEQLAALLVASGQASVFCATGAPMATAPALAMNQTVASYARFGDDYQVFASPLLGNGIGAGLIERMVYLLLAKQVGEHDIQALTQGVWSMMGPLGRRLIKEGKTLETAEENLPAIEAAVTDVIAHRLPFWRKLGMI